MGILLVLNCSLQRTISMQNVLLPKARFSTLLVKRAMRKLLHFFSVEELIGIFKTNMAKSHYTQQSLMGIFLVLSCSLQRTISIENMVTARARFSTLLAYTVVRTLSHFFSVKELTGILKTKMA